MLLREMTNPAFGRTFQRFVRLAVAGLALAGLAACGGGGSSTPAATAPTTPTPTPATPTPTPPEIPITPAPATDHPDTLEAAAVIAAGATVEGAIDSPDDVDFFRLRLTDPGTVTFWTTGEADTAIALLDGDGNDLSAASGSVSSGTAGGGAGLVAAAVDTANSAGRVSVTTGLDEVLAQVSGRSGGSTGDYTLHNEVAENLAPRVLGAIAPATVKAGSTTTVDLSGAFEDPEGGALTFRVSFGAGQVGPVSLGVTISGSVMNITSPAALQPGPVSLTVTASDPFGLVAVQVLTVTIQPADSAGGAGVDGCADASVGRLALGCRIVLEREGYEYHVTVTNTCPYPIDIRYQENPSNPEAAPGWGGPASFGVPAMGTRRSVGSSCFPAPIRPMFRICVSSNDDRAPDGSSNNCFGDNHPWREVN